MTTISHRISCSCRTAIFLSFTKSSIINKSLFSFGAQPRFPTHSVFIVTSSLFNCNRKPPVFCFFTKYTNIWLSFPPSPLPFRQHFSLLPAQICSFPDKVPFFVLLHFKLSAARFSGFALLCRSLPSPFIQKFTFFCLFSSVFPALFPGFLFC